MNESASATASMPVRPSCSRASDPLPCMLRTSGRTTPEAADGTCTITVRGRPPIARLSVVVPGLAGLPQPLDEVGTAALAARATPPGGGGPPIARLSVVVPGLAGLPQPLDEVGTAALAARPAAADIGASRATRATSATR